MSALVSAVEVSALIKESGVRVMDASYNHSPSSVGIPGALEFDIDDIADPGAPLAHTVPSADVFAAKMGALGINNDDLVVVYDRSGIAMSAARAWWMFRLYGHDRVKILNGGLPAWIREGYSLAEKSIQAFPSSFKAFFRPSLFKSLQEVASNIQDKSFTLLDARDGARFRGEAPDPRPHVQTGHVPGSLNTPFINFLNRDGTLKSKNELEKEFSGLFLHSQNKFACSCGSGVTACVVALALFELGHEDVAVYDGSWAEWGANPTLPKAKGG